MRRINRKAAILATATAGLAQLAWGANATWNGNVDTFWANTNWSSGGNSAYTAAANDVLVFDATAGSGTSLGNNNAEGTSFNGLIFNSTAQAYTLNGNGITLAGDITDNSTTGAQVIGFNITLNGNRTISVVPGGNAANGGTVTISGNISDGGNGFGITLVNNPLNRLSVGGGGTLGVFPFGSLILTGQNTYTGTTNVRSGKLVLDYTAATAPTSNIISASSPLVVGFSGDPKTGAGVGALTMTGKDGVTSSQSFARTTFGAGANFITATSGSGGTSNLNLGNISYTTGAAVAFSLPSSGAISASYPLDNGIIGGWATVGSDYATIVGGNVAAATYTDLANTFNNPSVAAGSNLRWGTNPASSGNSTFGSGATSVTDANTLIFTENVARTINVNGTFRLGANGGIFRSSGAGNNTLTIAGGSLTAGGGASHSGIITLTNNANTNTNANDLTISSTIQDNGSSAFPVTVVKTGPGSLVFGVSNGYTGGTYILEGRVQVGNASSFGSGPVYVEPGGHLFINNSLPVTAVTKMPATMARFVSTTDKPSRE